MNAGTLVAIITALSISHSQCFSIFRSSEPTKVPSPVDDFKSKGYYAETHTIHTPDGYILSAHRLLNTNLNFRKLLPEPFILQHGLLCNSGQWTILEPRQNLAFMLADNGFDVWMTNTRGNLFSRQHERLSPESAAFWDYSWHQHGTIDMPAIIDYVLNTTKHKQVWYAGHSMGTTMFFVMCSMRPEYNGKIRHMFALAPIAYMSNMEMSLKHLSSQVRTWQAFGKTSANNHLDAEFLLTQSKRFGVCLTFEKACAEGTNVIMGYNPRSNSSVTQGLLRYIPDSVSVGQLAHYAQLVNHPFKFRMFDYYEKNTLKYSSVEPPPYPVEKITAPITFLYSSNDNLAATVDVEAFSRKLKNVKMYLIPDPKFNHMDFIMSTYADEMVYNPILKIIHKLTARKSDQ